MSSCGQGVLRRRRLEPPSPLPLRLPRPARQARLERRASEHHERDEVVDAPEAVRLPDRHLDLVVDRLDAGVGDAGGHRADDAPGLAPDLLGELRELRGAAAARPGEPLAKKPPGPLLAQCPEDGAERLLEQVAAPERGAHGLEGVERGGAPLGEAVFRQVDLSGMGSKI